MPLAFQNRLVLVGNDGQTIAIVKAAVDTVLRGWGLQRLPPAETALSNALRDSPQVVVIEDAASHLGLLELAHRWRSDSHPLILLALLLKATDASLLAVLRDGADGCVTGDLTPIRFADALVKLLETGVYLCERSQRILLPALRNSVLDRGLNAVTLRECQVLSQVRRELSDKEIGQELGIAPGTVHVHLASAARKLQAHGRRDAADKFLNLTRFRH